MDRYGFFEYEDYPRGAEAAYIMTVYGGTGEQEHSETVNLFDTDTSIDYDSYRDWATFEKGEFDFEKPIYVLGTSLKIPNATTEVSDENGNIYGQIIVEAEDRYSGGGFTLRTYNDDYTIKMTVNDRDGTREKTFTKTEDEFYPFPYNGITRVTIDFIKNEPYHFFKTIAVSFGTVRKIGDVDFVEEPEIVSLFDPKSENIEYDTLDLTLFGNKDKYNFVTGERLRHSISKQEFYIHEAAYNNDGTFSVSCYDTTSLLESEVAGVIATGTGPESDIRGMIKNFLYYNDEVPINVTISSTLANTTTFTGMVEPMSKRDALQMMLQGNALVLQKANGRYNIFNLEAELQRGSNPVQFDESNIILGTPEIEIQELNAEYRFTKHYYRQYTQEGKQEVWHEAIPLNTSTRIDFEIPIVPSSMTFQYVSAVDVSTGEETLSPVPSGSIEVLVRGNFGVTLINHLDATIVITGYPYTESEYVQITKDDTVPTVFRNNIVEISDCTVMVSMSDYTAFRNHLKYIYGLNKIVRFESLRNAGTGRLAHVTYDGNDITGWITSKTDHMNGVYKYEVMYK